MAKNHQKAACLALWLQPPTGKPNISFLLKPVVFLCCELPARFQLPWVTSQRACVHNSHTKQQRVLHNARCRRSGKGYLARLCSISPADVSVLTVLYQYSQAAQVPRRPLPPPLHFFISPCSMRACTRVPLSVPSAHAPLYRTSSEGAEPGALRRKLRPGPEMLLTDRQVTLISTFSHMDWLPSLPHHHHPHPPSSPPVRSLKRAGIYPSGRL